MLYLLVITNYQFMNSAIYNRRLSIKELLILSFITLTKNAGTILAVILIVYIPINLMINLIPIGDSVDDLIRFIKISAALETFIGVIATMAIIHIIKAEIDNKRIDLKEALRLSTHKLGNSIHTNIISNILLLLLTILFIIPGIVFYIYWIFSIHAVALKNKTGMNALKYSKQLIKGQWLNVFGYSLVFVLIQILIVTLYISPIFVSEIYSEYLGYTIIPDTLFFNVLGDTMFSIVLSATIIMFTVLFINLDANRVKELGE